MPNWCNVYYTLMGVGPDGHNAITDLHAKLNTLWKQKSCKDLWWVEIEEYLLGTNVFRIPCSKRGYIIDISDLNFDTFHISCDDAWSANVAHLYSLLGMLYGNAIQINYIATEPGMCLFYTNDSGLLPRYNCNGYMELPFHEALGNPLLFKPMANNPCFVEKQEVQDYIFYPHQFKDCKGNYHYFDNAGIELYDVEGDEDYVIEEVSRALNLDDTKFETIDDLVNTADKYGLELSVDEFEYVPIEDLVESERMLNSLTESYKNINNPK